VTDGHLDSRSTFFAYIKVANHIYCL